MGKKNKKISEDMVEELRQDFGTITTEELIQKYKCSYSTIERFCKSHGFKSKRSNPTKRQYYKYPYLNNHVQEFLQDWEDNELTMEQLVEKYQASAEALRSKAIVFGIHRKKAIDSIQIDELIYDYVNLQINFDQICEKYNISKRVLNTILKNNQIDKRIEPHKNRKYFFNEHYLDIIDNEEKAYFLGFVYADGYINIKRHTLRITVQKQDEHLLKQFYQMFSCNREIQYIYNKQYNKEYAYFELQSKVLSARLLELGVQDNKTFKIRFPDWLDKNLYSHFIRGYFDGDGCISISKRGWKGTTINICSNKDFLMQLQNVIQQETNIKLNLYPCYNSKAFVLVKQGKNNLYTFLNFLYKNANIYLQRKYELYQYFIEQYEQEINNEQDRKN